MSRFHLISAALVLTSMTLNGCTTPRVALDQANNGAALAVSLESELNDFRRVQSQVAQARLDSIRRQRLRLASYEAEGAFDERVLRAAGKTDALNLFSTLQALSDSRAQEDTKLQAKIASMDEAFAKLLEPLPDTAKSLTATQGALASLGEELSTRERIATATSFVKEIRKTIDENKTKIDDAKAQTQDAPVQPEPEAPKK